MDRESHDPLLFSTWKEAAVELEKTLDRYDNYKDWEETHYSATCKFRRALSVLQHRLNATVNQDVRKQRTR